METPTREQGVPACEQCGYEVHAAQVAKMTSLAGEPCLCSECGTALSNPPWFRAPWPSKRASFRLLILPVIVIAVLFLAPAVFRSGRHYLIWPLLLLWVGAFILFGLATPITAISSLAKSRVPLLRRRAVVLRYSAVAVSINLLIALATFLIFTAII